MSSENDPMVGLSWNFAPNESQRCEATSLVHDDRWGAFRDRCDLLLNHAGPHAVEMSACEPLSYRVWWDEGQGPKGAGKDGTMSNRPEKVAHVRAARQDRNHTCHWPGCDKQVPPAMWGCKPHWFTLPKHLRDAIWASYIPGQEERMDPTPWYLAAAQDVQDWIAAQEGRE